MLLAIALLRLAGRCVVAGLTVERPDETGVRLLVRVVAALLRLGSGYDTRLLDDLDLHFSSPWLGTAEKPPPQRTHTLPSAPRWVRT